MRHIRKKKRRKRLPKSEIFKRHLLKRFRQRCDLELQDKDYLRLVKQIQNSKALFIRRGKGHRTMWNVKFNDKTYRVLYDNKHHALVTVLEEIKQFNNSI